MKIFYKFFPVLVGNLIYALIVKLFILPTSLMSSGTTGIALFMNHVFDIPVSLFILIFNLCMLIIGFLILGKTFAMTTIASTILYPVFLEFFNQCLGDYVITNNALLNTIFAGMGIGLALGIVIRSGASTGGMDIPPLLLHHYFRIPVSISLYVFDFIILSCQTLYNPMERLLYGILLILLTSVVLDKVLLMGTTRTEVKIISPRSQEIAKDILSNIDRGVTLLESKGGYSQQKQEVILTIISNRELPKIEKLIRQIDPDAFMVVSRVREVWGRGFSSKKQYQ
ncbi:YitT family protein [Faecalicoccus acidiformans]|uniref:YitT family protein n=1 Tax=Faecalicoccus acidiformans TaxID=915173 RepID=A0ABS2FRC8_9FIRM|nr:YitT family protein [Faecalicoccus acidiformans]MBM6832107.1 YitT family protein [Faecalicoccus acidiformans]